MIMSEYKVYYKIPESRSSDRTMGINSFTLTTKSKDMRTIFKETQARRILEAVSSMDKILDDIMDRLVKELTQNSFTDDWDGFKLGLIEDPPVARRCVNTATSIGFFELFSYSGKNIKTGEKDWGIIHLAVLETSH